MTKNKLIIHIGLPKTATTSFQDLLFMKLNSAGKVSYLGRSTKLSRTTRIYCEKMTQHFLGKGEFPRIEFNTNKVNLYSQEVLSAPSHTYNFSTIEKISSIEDVPERLYQEFSKYFSTMKIVLTLRCQQTMIPSFYTEFYNYYFKKKATNNPKRYIDYFIKNKAQYATWYYNELLDAYTKSFGEENISVLLFEELKSDKDKFYKKWADVLNISTEEIHESLLQENLNVKKEVKGGKIKHFRKMSIVLKAWIYFRDLLGINKVIQKYEEEWEKNQFRKLLEDKVFTRNVSKYVRNYTEEEKAIIFEHFKQSNQKLVGRFGLEENQLRDYGYI